MLIIHSIIMQWMNAVPVVYGSGYSFNSTNKVNQLGDSNGSCV